MKNLGVVELCRINYDLNYLCCSPSSIAETLPESEGRQQDWGGFTRQGPEAAEVPSGQGGVPEDHGKKKGARGGYDGNGCRGFDDTRPFGSFRARYAQ